MGIPVMMKVLGTGCFVPATEAAVAAVVFDSAFIQNNEGNEKGDLEQKVHHDSDEGVDDQVPHRIYARDETESKRHRSCQGGQQNGTATRRNGRGDPIHGIC